MRYRHILTFAYIFSIASLSLPVAIVFFMADWHYLALSLFFALFAYYKPKYSIYLLCLSLPLFGVDFDKTQSAVLTALFSSVLFGVYLKLFSQKIAYRRFLVKIKIDNISIFFLYLFLLTLLISIFNSFLLNGLYLFQRYHLKELVDLFSMLNIYTIALSSSSFVLLFQSFLLGLYMYAATRGAQKIDLFKKTLLSIAFGVVGYSIYWYVDFFYSLEQVWQIDSNILYRYTAKLFWHPLYTIVAIPMFFILFLYIKNRKISIPTFIFFLLLSEILVMLSMENTAWITYFVMLIIIWVGLYYVLHKIKNYKSDRFIKQNMAKIILSIPITLIVTIFLAYLIKGFDAIDFASIANNYTKKADENVAYWQKDIVSWAKNPIFGVQDGTLFDTTKDQKSHSLYLQTLSNKGFFSFIFLIGLIFSTLYMLIRREFLSIKALDIERTVLSLVTIGSITSLIIYANIQNIFYIQSFSAIFFILYFMGTSLAFSIATRVAKRRLKTMFRYALYSMLLMIPFHLLNISHIKDLIYTHTPFLSKSLLGSIVWIAMAAIFYAIFIQRKVIKHSSLNDFFIDCDKSDKPQMFHEAPTPRAGGIGIFLVNLFLIFNPIGWKFLVASIPSFFAGLVDDFKSLAPKVRLVFQLLSALLALYLLDFSIVTIGFGIQTPYLLGVAISILAIVGITNAMNIIDGFNGLSAGIATFVLISIASVSWVLQDMAIFEVAIINTAAILGFMLFNYPKGKIFLGDGGAFYIGFLLASLSLLFIYRNPQISIFYSLSILIYPIFEVLFSIYRKKVVRKTSPLEPDSFHFHMIIYKRVTKNNPATSRYIWIRVLPFMAIATIFYDNDFVQLGVIFCFCLFYVRLYKRLVKFKRHTTKF